MDMNFLCQNFVPQNGRRRKVTENCSNFVLFKGSGQRLSTRREYLFGGFALSKLLKSNGVFLISKTTLS